MSDAALKPGDEKCRMRPRSRKAEPVIRVPPRSHVLRSNQMVLRQRGDADRDR